MKPIEPLGDGELVIIAKDQPEYRQLPARLYTEMGMVETRWVFSEDERRAIMDGACLNLWVTTFNTPLQPLNLLIDGVAEE